MTQFIKFEPLFALKLNFIGDQFQKVKKIRTHFEKIEHF